MGELPHAQRTQDLLRKGRTGEAAKAHNARVTAELDRARNGETINLSDLMAAKEELHIDEIERDG